MRWIIAGVLAFYAYGSFSLAAKDWALYRCFLAESKLALVMGTICVATATAVVFGWGI